jgi:hypothetical protein
MRELRSLYETFLQSLLVARIQIDQSYEPRLVRVAASGASADNGEKRHP